LKRSAATLLVAGALPLLAGCRQDMHDQPKYQPLEASELFADGAASRTPVEGTVARGMLRDDSRLYRGMEADGSFVAEIPLPLTADLVARGRQRFDIYCSPCHGRTGEGQGMVVSRGFKQPESLHAERLRQSQDGYFYDVISNGFGQMSSYSSQVKPVDRWAIVAYVRALQLSRQVPADLLSETERQRLAEATAAAAAAAAPAQEPVTELEEQH
jgi:mono/diheme cytochrome c family protein